MGSEKGLSVIELLLVVLLLAIMAGAVVPLYLSTARTIAEQEVSYRLLVVQNAKKDVMENLNRILPRTSRIRITDRVNPLHYDMICGETLASPWHFTPDDPCPLGGTIHIGETFLDAPSSSLGIAIASIPEDATP